MSESKSHAAWINDNLLLRLRLTPKSSRDQVLGLMGDRIKVSITAAPIDGKANKHLLKLLSKMFKVAKSNITIVSGETDRDKTMCIEAPTALPDEFLIPLPKDSQETF